MVGNQIGNFTPSPSFGHNLCFTYPNGWFGSCDPILNIYVLRAFQWYKELFNRMSLSPWSRSLKIWKSIRIPSPKVGVHLGVWRFIHSHFPTFPGAWDVTPKLLLLVCTFANPCLSCEHKVGLQHVNFHTCHKWAKRGWNYGTSPMCWGKQGNFQNMDFQMELLINGFIRRLFGLK